MGLFNGLLGNASKMNIEVAQKELQDVLMPEEKVDLAFKLVRDLLVSTEKREIER